MSDTWITPAMRARIGVESEPYSQVAELGDLVRFARSTGETNPIYVDEIAARDTHHGGIIASPTWLITMRVLQNEHFSLENPLRNSVDGGSVWSFERPIRPGDTVTGVAHLADLYERDGRVGRMLFQVVQIRYTNQFGQLVATQRDTYIRFP